MSLISTLSAASQKGFQAPDVIQGTVLQAILTSPNPAPDNYFGYSMSMSETGDRLVIGEPGAPGTAGEAHIYFRTGDQWAFKQTLTDSVVNGSFGINVSISGDGDYITVSTDTPTNKTYIYNYNGSAFVNPSSTFFTGTVGQLNEDGTYAVVGQTNFTVSPDANAGRVQVWTRSGTVWSVQATLLGPNPEINQRFGYSVDISDNGGRVIIGTNPSLQGFGPYSSIRTGSTWTNPAQLDNNIGLGKQIVKISGDGLYLVATYLDLNYPAPGTSEITRIWFGTNQQPPTQKIYHPAIGYNISIDETGSILSGNSQHFDRSGTTWTDGTIYYHGNGLSFSGSCISNDGLHSSFWYQAFNSAAGAVYVY